LQVPACRMLPIQNHIALGEIVIQKKLAWGKGETRRHNQPLPRRPRVRSLLPQVKPHPRQVRIEALRSGGESPLGGAHISKGGESVHAELTWPMAWLGRMAIAKSSRRGILQAGGIRIKIRLKQNLATALEFRLRQGPVA